MFDVHNIVQAGGLLVIAAIIFGESGMFIGFFFPGDTLLLSAGVFAAQGHLDLALTIAIIAAAAIAGDNVGYHIGKRYGRKLFRKPDGLIFRQEYMQRAEHFYERFGSKTMLIAHFVPVVRTFAPPVAGIAHMPYKKYILFDAIGDTVWATVVTLIGYWFGSKIPNIDHYILAAVVTVMVVTLGPTVYHLVRAIWQKKHSAKS
jgi:membrane-associated protein